MQLSPAEHSTKSGPEINYSRNIKRTLFSNHYPTPSLRSGSERRSRGRNKRPVPHTDPEAPAAGHRQPRAQTGASWQK